MVRTLWQHVDYADVARVLSTAGKYEAALDACERGLQLRGREPLLLLRRAQAYDALERYDEAIDDCVAVVALDPPAPVAALAAMTAALAHESNGCHAEALAAARAAIARAPDDARLRGTYGNLLAWHGNLAEAWPELECHWIAERAAFAARLGTEWSGEDIAGRRILVVHGQGAGDMIQMARYLPRLRERAAHLTLECRPALVPLLRDLPGIDAIAAPGSVARTDVDVFARLMSLPRLLGETGTAVAAPYLRVPPGYATRWYRPADRERTLRVGLAWAGNPFHARDRWRSLPITAFDALAGIAGIHWTSLQIGPRANEADRAAMPLERHDAEIANLADTAAIIAQLDLVIAVDTAVAHLAGALGTPVWLLLPARPDWRWLRHGHVTPWYRSMRLMRIRRADLPGTIDEVERRLHVERTRRCGVAAGHAV